MGRYVMEGGLPFFLMEEKYQTICGYLFRIGNQSSQSIPLAMENLLMAAIWCDEKKGIHSNFYKKGS